MTTSAGSLNRLGLTTSESYELWYRCRRKRPYITEDEALTAAFWTQDEISTPRVYRCDWGDHWHIGHAPITDNEKRRRARFRNRPSEVQVALRPDLATFLAIGERAWYCGKAESTGRRGRRLRAIRSRAAKALKRRQRRELEALR